METFDASMGLGALTTLAGVTFFGKKLIDWLKYVRVLVLPDGGTKAEREASRRSAANAVATQLGAWVVGITLAFLIRVANALSDIQIGSVALSDFDAWSTAYIGMATASVGSFLHDRTKAKDNTQSAAMPSLIPDKSKK